MTVLQSEAVGRDDEKGRSTPQKERPEASVETAYADTNKQQKEAWKNGEQLSRKTGGAGDYQLSFSLLPSESPSQLYCSPQLPSQLLARIRGPRLSRSD